MDIVLVRLCVHFVLHLHALLVTPPNPHAVHSVFHVCTLCAVIILSVFSRLPVMLNVFYFCISGYWCKLD